MVTTAPGRAPLIGHLVQLAVRPLGFLQSLRSYGDVVRIHLGTRSGYVVNDPALIQHLLVDNAHAVDKGFVFDNMRVLTGNGLANSCGSFHLQQRRHMQPAFHHKNIARYVDDMWDVAAERTSTWRQGEVMSLNDQMHVISLRILTKTLFATDPPETLEKSLRVVTAGLITRTLSPASLVHRLPTTANRRFAAAHQQLHAVVDEMIAACGGDGEDLLSVLVRARMPHQQIHDEVISTLFAGTETTAAALTWLCHELARHPVVAQRVREELAGHPLTIDGPEYCHRVVLEVLRLHSPAWMLTRRSLTEVRLGERTFPSGTDFIYSPATVHRDAGYYPDPLRFDPDRWLSAKPALRLFIPFGSGVHKCIGDSFAATVLRTVMAAISRQWRLEPVPGKTVREEVRSVVSPSEVLVTAVRW